MDTEPSLSILPAGNAAVVDQRIIVPLDVPTEDEALRLLDQLPEVRFWKVGLELFVSTGPQILQELKSRHCQIFLDLKFHDIPNTVISACRSAAQWQVDLLTVHAVVGQAGLTQAQTALNQLRSQTRLIAVTLLTSVSPQQLTEELGVTSDPLSYTQRMAKIAQASGLAGVVCSPLEAAALRQAYGKDFILVCPGVRPSWAAPGDQQRVMTPLEAIRAGADYLVIGRPITAAADPQVAFARICEEVCRR